MKNKIHKLKKLKFLLIFLTTILTINYNFKNNYFKVKATSSTEEAKKLEEIKAVLEIIAKQPAQNQEETKKTIEKIKEIIGSLKNDPPKNEPPKNDPPKNPPIALEETKKMVQPLIGLPTEQNKNKPVVILNPGHGFEDPGCSVKNPYFNKLKDLIPNKETIQEKVLNQLICYELTLSLLKEGFEVYLVFDFADIKDLGINLPKDNPSLHILFKERPPKNYKYSANNDKRIAFASAFCIKQIFEKLIKNNNNAKIVSLCLHHNASGAKEPHGFQPFYCNDSAVSETFKKNGQNLCNIILKNCKFIYNYDKNLKWSGVRTEQWAVCRFGKDFTPGKHAAALLLELGFVTNDNELKEILNTNKKKEMANAITNSLKEYFSIDK